VVIGGISFAAINASGPSTADLLTDISEVQQQIEETKAFGAQYREGSALRGVVDLRLAVLETTRAMLEQKRRSWLRGINLTFTAEGNLVPPVDKETVAAITQEVDKAKRDAASAHSRAAQYSGGLIQSMALLEEQTHLVTLAAAQMRLTMARYGIRIADVSKAKTQAPPPVGKIIDDKGAL